MVKAHFRLGQAGGLKGLSFVAWDAFTLSRDQWGLGLPDIQARGSIFSSKWIVCALEGEAPW
jgi:hypothetical protein